MNKPQPMLVNLQQLKAMAKEAETMRNLCSPTERWHRAYSHIAAGTSLLWRLIDECEKNYGPGPDDAK